MLSKGPLELDREHVCAWKFCQYLFKPSQAIHGAHEVCCSAAVGASSDAQGTRRGRREDGLQGSEDCSGG